MYRDNKPLSDEELNIGRLSAALAKFDEVIRGCRLGICPKLETEWLTLLDELSLDKCTEMKAYHIWRAKGKPWQNETKFRVEDWQAACKDIEVIISCRRNLESDLGNQIKSISLQKTPQELNKKKALLYSMRYPWKDALENFYSAINYVNSVLNILGGQSAEIVNLIKPNTSMVSMLDLFVICCINPRDKFT